MVVLPLTDARALLRSQDASFFAATPDYRMRGASLGCRTTGASTPQCGRNGAVLLTGCAGQAPRSLQQNDGRSVLAYSNLSPGIARGSLSGGLPAEDQAIIGLGQVNWPQVMKAAERDGLEYYYLEDETPDPVNNVPKSISYLERLKY
jgi:hypothetical protein